jgi:FSR family fosmidomycin resistance protein-like MFS transporter
MNTSTLSAPASAPVKRLAEQTVLPVLFAISFSHLLNDTIQSLIPALYPVFRQNLHLDYGQIGWITFAFQCTASFFQPLVGQFTDRRPMPYSLAVGMGISLIGLLFLSMAGTFAMVVGASAMVGLGSAIFHPEASRVAYMASGGKRGFAQSLFQVGGNAGSSFGPLLAMIMASSQGSTAWSSLIAGLGILILWRIGNWTSHHLELARKKKQESAPVASPFPRKTVIRAMLVLVALIFSKYVYLTSMTSYYTLYLIDRFKVSVHTSQIHLFVFLFAVAAGTFLGGPIGDRFGRKKVIWVSILGVAPFSLWLPHAGLVTTMILTIFIGLILAYAFSAILVYAQELVPGRIGQIAGVFFGLAFGIAGVGSAALGHVADCVGIQAVYNICGYLPLIGILTILLPEIEAEK